MFKSVMVGVSAIAIVAAMTAFGLGYRALVQPASVHIDNMVFKESQQYNDGMRNDINDFRVRYEMATPEGKSLIAAVIIQRTASYDISRLPADQQNWIRQIRGF